MAFDVLRGGLLVIQQGAQGGVRLNLPADQITIADIIEIVDGSFVINPCLAESEQREKESFCPIRRILWRAQNAMKVKLNRESLQEILKEQCKILCNHPQALAAPEKARACCFNQKSVNASLCGVLPYKEHMFALGAQTDVAASTPTFSR